MAKKDKAEKKIDDVEAPEPQDLVEVKESSSKESDYDSHPKFAKFKKRGFKK